MPRVHSETLQPAADRPDGADALINDREQIAVDGAEPARRYDEEILNVNWNPVIALIAMSSSGNEGGAPSRLPEDLTTIDVDAFLGRVYAFA
jgi:hypothetical protein